MILWTNACVLESTTFGNSAWSKDTFQEVHKSTKNTYQSTSFILVLLPFLQEEEWVVQEENFVGTGSEINHSFLFHGVLKNLTACGMLRISIARCQIEPEIHSFPTMYIMGGGKYVRNGSNQWFCPKNRPQIMFFYWHISGSSNFGGVWYPQILKCRHFC